MVRWCERRDWGREKNDFVAVPSFIYTLCPKGKDSSTTAKGIFVHEHNMYVVGKNNR